MAALSDQRRVHSVADVCADARRVVLVQNLLISGIVGCFAATAQDLAEKRLTRPVRPAWFALVYLPFLLPPVLMHTQQPFRTTWSTWTELFWCSCWWPSTCAARS